jgi:hypothetical protein
MASGRRQVARHWVWFIRQQQRRIALPGNGRDVLFKMHRNCTYNGIKNDGAQDSKQGPENSCCASTPAKVAK